MIPIIDSHHHIWRQADLEWLQGPEQPRVFGPYKPLQRDYLIEEFKTDLASSNVVGSVYVQTNWPKGKEVEETAWVQSVADQHGWPHGIVGYVDLLSDNAADTVERLAAYPLLCGVRMQLHWHENPLYRFAADPDLASDARLRRNIRALAHHGLAFDLQVFASQTPGAAALAAANRDITFVLQHAGMLEDLSPTGVNVWREGMKRLAGEPNIVVKLSAFGTFKHCNDPAHTAFMAGETIAMFGAERCMFGSNFPIEKLWTTYAEVVTAHRQALEHLTPAAQRQVLHDTAARVYRLNLAG